jgi:L-asparaginase
MKVLHVTPWAPYGHCRLDKGSRLPHSFARMFCPVHRGPPDGRRRDVAHIQLLGTGGTIASRGSRSAGSVATDAAADLARGEYGGLRVSTRDVLRTNSYRFTLGDLRLIAEAVQEALLDRDTDGVVVTHGTDTLEETAFLLDLVHRSVTTVVLTGAQQPADSLAPDGPRNVEEAALAAASPALHDSGVLISFNGTVRSARGARKAHTTASSPFQGGTEVAHMAGGRLVVTATPRRSHQPLPLPSAGFDTARVEIITACPGASRTSWTSRCGSAPRRSCSPAPAWATRAPASPSESRRPSRAGAR